MIYRSDFGFHGHMTSLVEEDALRREPSLTLCTVDTFAEWSGPFSKRVFTEIAGTSAFQRIAARAAADPTVSIRTSVYVTWLEPQDFPSHRPDWLSTGSAVFTMTVGSSASTFATRWDSRPLSFPVSF